MTNARVRVGDVLRLQRIPVNPVPSAEYVSIGIRSFGKGVFHYEPKAGDALPSLRFFEVQPDRLLLSNIKAWEGAIAVSSDADSGCVASNRFLSYVPVGDQVDVRWARWYFLSDSGIAQIQRASPGSADRNRTLAIDRFEALEIPLPPIEDQRRVAKELDQVAAAATRIRHRLDRASTLTDALAVSFSARPDLDETAKARAGWRRAKLRSVISPAVGQTTVDPELSYANLGIYSFGKGLFETPDIDGSVTSAKVLHRIRAGQFIYSRLFAFEGAYTYVPPEFDGYFVSNEFPSFDVDPDNVDARWLANYLRSPTRWAELGGASKGIGVRRKRVPVDAVMQYEVSLPPISEQRAIVAIIDRLDRIRARRAECDNRIASLVPAALNRAFGAAT